MNPEGKAPQLAIWSPDTGLSDYAARQAAISRLMTVVFAAGYLGKPPRGYDPARDASILRGWLCRGRTEEEIRTAIEGLRQAVENGTVEWVNPENHGTLRAGQAFTLRALVNTKSGDRFTWDVATDEGFKTPQGPMPENLKDVLRKAIG